MQSLREPIPAGKCPRDVGLGEALPQSHWPSAPLLSGQVLTLFGEIEWLTIERVADNASGRRPTRFGPRRTNESIWLS
jgi:hypothetical protein